MVLKCEICPLGPIHCYRWGVVHWRSCMPVFVAVVVVVVPVGSVDGFPRPVVGICSGSNQRYC
jgi:hypothetical protein